LGRAICAQCIAATDHCVRRVIAPRSGGGAGCESRDGSRTTPGEGRLAPIPDSVEETVDGVANLFEAVHTVSLSQFSAPVVALSGGNNGGLSATLYGLWSSSPSRGRSQRLPRVNT
jgi:hypothetical protein